MPQSMELSQAAATNIVSAVATRVATRKERQNVTHSPYLTDHSHDEIAQAELVDLEGGLSRLLAAAVINRRLHHTLLTNPKAVLQVGYQGEPFGLSATEVEILVTVRAETLIEFARLLLKAVEAYNERLLTRRESPI